MSMERTKANKARRMAKHAKMYPHTSTRSAAERRAMGKAWKAEAAHRAKA
jgi:hypothetical protein